MTLLMPHPKQHLATKPKATEAYSAVISTAISEALGAPLHEGTDSSEKKEGGVLDTGRGKPKVPTLAGWHVRFNLERHGLRVSRSLTVRLVMKTINSRAPLPFRYF